MTYRLFVKARHVKELGKWPKIMTVLANIYQIFYIVAWSLVVYALALDIWGPKFSIMFNSLIIIGSIPMFINFAYWS